MNDKSDTENEITGRIKMINPKTDKTIPEINKRNIHRRNKWTVEINDERCLAGEINYRNKHQPVTINNE